MDDDSKKAADKEALLSEIRRMLDEFEANFNERTSDPDNFATFSELEGMLGKLIGSTKDLYIRNAKARLDEQKEKSAADKGGDPDGDGDEE